MAAVINSFPVSDIRVLEPLDKGLFSASGATSYMSEERLPFTVRLVRTEHELAKAVAVRHAAYARHLPDFAEQLRQPELSDFSDECAVLLAESRLDGSPLGTMRIETNRRDPLPLERSVELPEWLRGDAVLAEAVRLGVTEGSQGHLVKTVLFKAFFQYCEAQSIDWMVIAGRSPLDRQYRRLMFKDVFPDRGLVPLQHANNIPHRVMCFKVNTARTLPGAEQHSFYDFLFRTYHPDIQLGLDGSTLHFSAANAYQRISATSAVRLDD